LVMYGNIGMNQTGRIMNCKNIIALSLTRVLIGIEFDIIRSLVAAQACLRHTVFESHLK